jgi:hypothetical protein
VTTEGGGFGPIGNIIVGIVGALIGSFVFGLLGITASGLIGSLITGRCLGAPVSGRPGQTHLSRPARPSTRPQSMNVYKST